MLTTDRREYRRGESVRLRVRFADERLAPAEDDGVTVVLEHQGHKTRRIQLHRSTAGRGMFEGLVEQAADRATTTPGWPSPTSKARPRRSISPWPPRRASSSGCEMDAADAAAGGRNDQGPFLHLRRRRPAAERPARRPPGPRRVPPPQVALEPLAAVAVVPLLV